MSFLSFRGMLRPGQGFKQFRVLRENGTLTEKGRPVASGLKPKGEFLGIITQASPKEIEQHKQLGTPITHTIVQYGTANRARATDVLELTDCSGGDTPRRFLVQGEPKDPGELGHFLIYTVQERADLQ